jgi:hypothetical protein
MKTPWILVLPITSMLSLLPAAAFAQGAPSATPAPGTATVEVVNGRRVYHYEFGIVYGEAQRPYAFTVTNRGSLGYTAVDDRRNFTPEVLTVLRRAPF